MTRHRIKTPYIRVRMGLEYFVVLLSLLSASTQGKPVTGFPATSVTEFPETSITEFFETSVTEFPETTITDVSETSVTEVPETTIIGFPVKTVTGIPKTTVTGLSEMSINGFHETTVTGFPQTKVTGFTESSVNGFPETTVTGFPESTVTVLSDSSVTSFPETTVTGSSETTVTWIDAALHCYDHHTILENNITILTDYIHASNSVKGVWVGSFIAWLPWIEMRGCYNISADKDTVTDIQDVDDSALCQVKCTKTWRTSSQYFGFNQHDHRCVCLEHERFVNKSSANSSLCSNCMAANACHEFVDVYKVVNETCDGDQTNEDKFCLARNCSTETPNYSKSKCDSYFKAYCRNKIEAYTGSMTFQTLVANCKVRHSTYPLLRSDIICNNAKQGDTTVMYWVGVNRQKLYLTSLDKLDLTDFQNTQSSIRKFAYLSHFNNHTVSGNRSTKFSFVCKPDLTDNSTIRSTTILNNAPDMMVGIVVSLVVITLILVVLLVVLLRRKYSKDKLSLKTAGREDRDTNEMENYIIISDYQQLDKVKNRKTKTKPYDQLHVKHIVDLYPTDDHSNTLFSKEENNKYESIENTDEIDNNKVTLEYEVLDKTQQDKITKAYDQLHYTHVVDTDSTYNHSTTIIESEEKHKTSTNTTSLEYEELNNAEKDKSVNVYEQLNTTNEGNFNSNMSKTMISTEEHINNESIEAATAMNKHTVTLEYAQLDIAGKDEGMNVYDQLYVTP